ncbi:MAG: polyprenyl synthetase family protein [Propionibacteriaceae bacterium]|nr:polyprenyl synthetase family protein [Propionibacteriaceae bacterium]
MADDFHAEAAFGEQLIAQVDAEIEEFLYAKNAELAAISSNTTILGQLAQTFTSGGKRIRPAYCIWGYLSVAMPENSDALVRAAASLELLHVSELIHDDVMDGSDTRRGQPAAHRQFQRWHSSNQLLRDSEVFGKAGAIILGDLLAKWATELFEESGFDAQTLNRGRGWLERMRTEVSAGQFLDLQAQAFDLRTARTNPQAALQFVEQVVEYKTARYTVVRPLQIGAAMAGGTPSLLETMTNYGSATGRAFQYRDDVLGLFGDPAVTGKPAGDDLREGKFTILIAKAMSLAGEDQALQLAASLGRPDLTDTDIGVCGEIIQTCGALEAVETAIDDSLNTALHTIRRDPYLRPAAVNALIEMAYAAANRDH